MHTKNKYIALSALFMAIAIGFGAFGAHIIKPGLDVKYIATLNTANEYFIFHSLALLLISTLMRADNYRTLNWIYIFITLGIILFSGSLYWIVMCNYFGLHFPSPFGLLTPIGGMSFIIAWLLMAYHFYRAHHQQVKPGF